MGKNSFPTWKKSFLTRKISFPARNIDSLTRKNSSPMGKITFPTRKNSFLTRNISPSARKMYPPDKENFPSVGKNLLVCGRFLSLREVLNTHRRVIFTRNRGCNAKCYTGCIASWSKPPGCRIRFGRVCVVQHLFDKHTSRIYCGVIR